MKHTKRQKDVTFPFPIKLSIYVLHANITKSAVKVILVIRTQRLLLLLHQVFWTLRQDANPTVEPVGSYA
jgi:hypothetical protein